MPLGQNPNQSAVPDANADGSVKLLPCPGQIRHVSHSVFADSAAPSGSARSESEEDRKDRVRQGLDRDREEPGFYQGYGWHRGPLPVGPVRRASRDPNQDSQHSNQQRGAHQRNDPDEPCLFHSYTGCLKGHSCEYSHLIHADQVRRKDQIVVLEVSEFKGLSSTGEAVHTKVTKSP